MARRRCRSASSSGKLRMRKSPGPARGPAARRVACSGPRARAGGAGVGRRELHQRSLGLGPRSARGLARARRPVRRKGGGGRGNGSPSTLELPEELGQLEGLLDEARRPVALHRLSLVQLGLVDAGEHQHRGVLAPRGALVAGRPRSRSAPAGARPGTRRRMAAARRPPAQPRRPSTVTRNPAWRARPPACAGRCGRRRPPGRGRAPSGPPGRPRFPTWPASTSGTVVPSGALRASDRWLMFGWVRLPMLTRTSSTIPGVLTGATPGVADRRQPRAQTGHRLADDGRAARVVHEVPLRPGGDRERHDGASRPVAHRQGELQRRPARQAN